MQQQTWKLKDGDEVKFGEYVTFMKVEGGGWTSGAPGCSYFHGVIMGSLYKWPKIKTGLRGEISPPN